MTVIDWHVRQLGWWKKKLGISDYGVAWIAFAKGLVLGYALCFFIYVGSRSVHWQLWTTLRLTRVALQS